MMPRIAPMTKPLPRLDARIRVERRRELLSDHPDLSWDEGDPLQFDDQNVAEWDEQAVGDDAGNVEGEWTGIGPAILRAEIKPLSAGSDETMIAGKLRGVYRCQVIVRSSRFTRSIVTDDRFVIVTAERETALNIRQAMPPGRGGYVTFMCEAGVTI